MDFTYGGLFPFINIGTEYLIDRNGYFNAQKIYWNELLELCRDFRSTESEPGPVADQPGRGR